MEELAIFGGKPVRESKMVGPYPGGSVYGAEEAEAVCEVIRRKSPFRYYGENVQGTVRNFEDMVSKYFDIPYVHACSSGTAAVVLSLIGIGVEPGDRIVVPANTFYATASASIFAGGIPVYCDVDHSMNINPDALEKILAEGGIKAVIVVPLTLALPHFFGLGVNGVFLAEPISNYIGGAACYITMLLTVWRDLKKADVEAQAAQ